MFNQYWMHWNISFKKLQIINVTKYFSLKQLSFDEKKYAFKHKWMVRESNDQTFLVTKNKTLLGECFSIREDHETQLCTKINTETGVCI